jgi:hypothetical protein
MLDHRTKEKRGERNESFVILSLSKDLLFFFCEARNPGGKVRGSSTSSD